MTAKGVESLIHPGTDLVIPAKAGILSFQPQRPPRDAEVMHPQITPIYTDSGLGTVN